jgi:hypothetical protein
MPMTLSCPSINEHGNFWYVHSRNGDGTIFAL